MPMFRPRKPREILSILKHAGFIEMRQIDFVFCEYNEGMSFEALRVEWVLNLSIFFMTTLFTPTPTKHLFTALPGSLDQVDPAHRESLAISVAQSRAGMVTDASEVEEECILMLQQM